MQSWAIEINCEFLDPGVYRSEPKPEAKLANREKSFECPSDIRNDFRSVQQRLEFITEGDHKLGAYLFTIKPIEFSDQFSEFLLDVRTLSR